MRCFAAIELNDAWRAALMRIVDRRGGPRGIRWCSRDQLHITLKFLGDVEDAQVPDVCRAVDAASREIAPFTLCLAGLGCFPSRGWPRVLWAGVDDPGDGAARWLATAEPLFEEIGFPAETRPYHRHVTLARAKTPRDGDALRERSQSIETPSAVELAVDRVVLYESRLTRDGAVYVVQHTAKLGSDT